MSTAVAVRCGCGLLYLKLLYLYFYLSTLMGTDVVVGVLHCLVGRTPNVGHQLHHEFSSGNNAFLTCRTPAALYFTQPIIRTIFPSLTGNSKSTLYLLLICSSLLHSIQIIVIYLCKYPVFKNQ